MATLSLVWRRWQLALISGSLFLFSALLSELVVHQPNGLTALWPCNAIILALLLTRAERGRIGGRADLAAILIGAWVGSFLSNLIGGQPLAMTVIFPFANVIEAMLAAYIVWRIGGVAGAFDRIFDVLAFMVACIAAPLVSALIGAVALMAGTGLPFAEGWLGWYVAGVLSLAIVTPGVVVAIHFVKSAKMPSLHARQASEAMLVLGMVAAAAIGLFHLGTVQLLFMMLPFVLLATFRLRQFGAVASIAIVALVSANATAYGLGPIARSGLAPADQILFLQLFLAVTFMTSLPVAAILAERDQRADEAHLLADHFKAVVENISEVIFRTDRSGRWTYLNPAWETLSGYRVKDSVGRSLMTCIDPEERETFSEWAVPVLAGDVRATRRMLRFHTAGGAVRWMELCMQGLRDKDGSIVGATGTLRDIDDRKRLEDHVLTAKRHAEERARAATLLASTDELTALANRRAFLRHLDRQIEAANEFGWSLAVAIFDVDHFKAVNDLHGHPVGDRVLQRVAARAVAVVRSGDLVGRLGGEEFGILMPGASPDDAAAVAERLRQAIEAPRRDGEEETLPGVTVSIGIASHETGETAGILLADADTALYAAKGAGRNRINIAA